MRAAYSAGQACPKPPTTPAKLAIAGSGRRLPGRRVPLTPPKKGVWHHANHCGQGPSGAARAGAGLGPDRFPPPACGAGAPGRAFSCLSPQRPPTVSPYILSLSPNRSEQLNLPEPTPRWGSPARRACRINLAAFGLPAVFAVAVCREVQLGGRSAPCPG